MPPEKISETFERYAVGLARGERLPPGAPDWERRRALLDELVRRGIKGWVSRGTLFTRHLPAGCYGCLQGRGSNLAVTTMCTRECFFCFNPKPRDTAMSAHGRAVSSEQEAADILGHYAIRSVGLSGGEPLLEPGRVLRLIHALRRRHGGNLRIDLYTNGDPLTPGLAHQLRLAGLDGLRLNLAANGYDAAPARLALAELSDVEVEIPVIPEHAARLRRLIRELDKLGVRNLILHELFVSAQNLDNLRRRGCREKEGERLDKLSWSGVAASDEAALELLLYALDHAERLSVYYCSCATQQWIAERSAKNQHLIPG